MSVAHFPVTGKLDSAGGRISGTFSIDRATGLVTVRPKGRRMVYEMPLSSIADWVCHTVLAAKAIEDRALKKAKRAARVR